MFRGVRLLAVRGSTLVIGREAHELKLKSKGHTTDAITLSGSGPVLPRLRQCFDKLNLDFNKGSVGKLIRRDLVRCQSVAALPIGVAKKGETLLTALRDAFMSAPSHSGDLADWSRLCGLVLLRP